MSFMLTPEAIKNIVESAEEALEFMRNVSGMSIEMIISDRKTLTAFKYCFLVVAQAILTFSNYLVIKKKLGVPRSFQESISMLVAAKLIPKNLEDTARMLVDMRDKVLHEGLLVTAAQIKMICENVGGIEAIYRKVRDEVSVALPTGEHS